MLFRFRTGDSGGIVFIFLVDDGRNAIFANNFEEFIDFTVLGLEVFVKLREGSPGSNLENS